MQTLEELAKVATWHDGRARCLPELRAEHTTAAATIRAAMGEMRNPAHYEQTLILIAELEAARVEIERLRGGIKHCSGSCGPVYPIAATLNQKGPAHD